MRMCGMLKLLAPYLCLVSSTLASTYTCCASQAFKSYDEAGNSRRVQCLKYMVLANMLMESKVDPFDAQEAKPYKQDPEVGPRGGGGSVLRLCVNSRVGGLSHPQGLCLVSGGQGSMQ
jgi:hypothetical protein